MGFKDEAKFGKLRDAIYYVVESGIMFGYTDGEFKQNNPVRYDEFWGVLSSFSTYACRVPKSENNRYKELAKFCKGKWYEESVINLIMLLSNDDVIKERDDADWKNAFECGQIKQEKAVFLLKKLCKIVYKTDVTLKWSKKSVTRGWIAKQMYLCSKQIISRLREKVGKDDISFLRECLSMLGEFYIPNYRILAVDLDTESDEYKLLSCIGELYWEQGYCVQNEQQRIEAMINCMTAVNEFKRDIEKTEPFSGYAYHYTSLSALQKMIEKSSTREIDGLYVTLHKGNVEYLNDPCEGEVLIKYIRGEWSENFGENVEPRNEYILSLISEKEEHLPMWVHYGDGGLGCRIEFEICEEANFRRVKYIDTKKLEDYSKEEELFRKLREYISTFEKDKQAYLSVEKWIEYLLREIGYYYKDIFYSYENEIRVVSRHSPKKTKVYDTVRDGEVFGRMYVENATPLRVVSVTLGPKCAYPERIALALKRAGINVVKRSKVNYR